MENHIKIIQAAVQIIVKPVLNLIQNDPHQWSTRPCSTCKTISELTGKDFGCVLYAKERGIKQ